MTSSVFTFFRAMANALSFGSRFTLPRSVARRAFRHAKATETIDDFDGSLTLDLRLSEHMERRIFWMGYYNGGIVAYLDQFLQKGMVVADVGANIGEISLVSGKRVGSGGRVLAFEPVDEIADELQKNVHRNRLDQVQVVRLGLSDVEVDRAPIYASCGQSDQGDEHRGLGSLYGEQAEGTPLQFISVTTLDDYLDRHPLERLDVVKVDIEGAELPFLRGAEQSLRRFRPVLIVEVQDRTAHAAGYSPKDVFDYLTGLGYSFSRIDGKGRLSPVVAADSMYENVLCEPTASPRS